MHKGHDPKKMPSRPEEFEEHVPEEVYSDPVLWCEIQDDPAIWPENKTAAYRAALRGERDWWFASSGDLTTKEVEPVRPSTRGREIP